jgi:hypothetical protein
MLEDVEKIHSRLTLKPLPEFELPAQGHINLRNAESAQDIASEVSMHRRAGYDECGRINFFSAGYVLTSGSRETSQNEIRTLHTGGPCLPPRS